jgi:uncharacterized protein
VSDEAKATRFEPPITPEAEPFWEASRDQRFVLPWCTDCGKAFWYPRPVCPVCLRPNVEWRPGSGRGEVHAVSVMYRPGNPMMADRVPYAVALVELEEGVRIMSNVVGIEADQVKVGMPVGITWEPMSDGRHLPLFEPEA